MPRQRDFLKKKVIILRKKGKTYREIQKSFDAPISKSVISYWCNGINLSENQRNRIQKIILENIKRGRVSALRTNKIKRELYLKSIFDRVKHLGYLIENKDIAKIVLAMLYLGEGSKVTRGSLVFGNSDPKIISVFVDLLRYCYDVDETKFRVTVQCRADQNAGLLEKFWVKRTGIPHRQFYKPRKDPRTIGSVSRKLDYKGVCRIDYFSAEIFNELRFVAESIYERARSLEEKR